VARPAATRRAPLPASWRESLRGWLDRLPTLTQLADAREPVIVGCSGGADSLALLALTAAAAGASVVAVYIDHGLRTGSGADFAVVAAAAAGLDVSATSSRITLDTGPNLEARARTARYEALEQARLAVSASTVLIAHTADDQAETVLLNLLRGAATAGLAAMATRHGTVVRPILGLRRRDTLEICARLGLAPIDDPMNCETRFRRVWLRREVLPALEAGADRDLRGVLARQAQVMRDESDLLDALAREALAGAGDPPAVRAIAALEPALARRALRQWLGGPPPSLATIDALLAVVAGDRRALELPGGRQVMRRGGRLILESCSPSSPRLHEIEASIAAPCQFALPGSVAAGGTTLESWVERAAPVAWPDGRETCVVDADAVGDRAWLRPAGRRERFAPLGLHGTKPVTAACAETDATAPAARRFDPPQVVATAASGGVVWVVGYRIDDRVRVTSRTRRFLWMTVSARASA
jgi:tRNA(Ile)-lysidine synthase